jgi:hypothetical protein
VTRASSTAAGRACECRALGGGCVLNDASFQRETRRNSHTARQRGVVPATRALARRGRSDFTASMRVRFVCSRQTNRVRDRLRVARYFSPHLRPPRFDVVLTPASAPASVFHADARARCAAADAVPAFLAERRRTIRVASLFEIS